MTASFDSKPDAEEIQKTQKSISSNESSASIGTRRQAIEPSQTVTPVPDAVASTTTASIPLGKFIYSFNAQQLNAYLMAGKLTFQQVQAIRQRQLLLLRAQTKKQASKEAKTMSVGIEESSMSAPSSKSKMVESISDTTISPTLMISQSAPQTAQSPKEKVPRPISMHQQKVQRGGSDQLSEIADVAMLDEDNDHDSTSHFIDAEKDAMVAQRVCILIMMLLVHYSPRKVQLYFDYFT